MVVIAVLTEVATREGDDVAAGALGAGADRVSHIDGGCTGGGLGGDVVDVVDVRAHGDCGVVSWVVQGCRVAEWQSVVSSVERGCGCL